MKILHKFLPILIVFLLLGCSTSKDTAKQETIIEKPQYFLKSGEIDTSAYKYIALNNVILGSKYQMMNRHAEAVIEFQEAVRYDTAAAIYFAMAKSYKELAKMDLAIENINKALNLDPSFFPAWDLLVEVYLMNYQLKEAISTVEKINLIEPNRERRIMLARLYEFEDIDKAIDIYEKVLDESLDISILKRLSYLYRQNNQEEEYSKSLLKLYQIGNTDVDLIFDLMEYYVTNEDYDSINPILEDVNKTFPSSDLSYIFGFLANEYIKSNTEIKPENIEALISKIDSRFYFDWYLNAITGELSIRNNDIMKAKKHFERSLKLADTLYHLPTHIAYTYFYHKHYRECADILERYEKDFPDSLMIYFLAADAYYKLNEVDKAIEKVKIVLSKDSNNVDALAQLSSYYEKQGNQEKAFATFEKALRLDRGSPLVNNNYAYSLAEAEVDLDRALQMSNIAISAEPDNAAYLDTYGWIKFKLGDLETAEKYIKRALEILPAAELYEHLGDIYEAKGNLEDAVSNWQKALELEPERTHLNGKLKK